MKQGHDIPEIKVSAVCAFIGSAFANTQYPGDDNLGYSPEHPEGIYLTRLLRGKKWQDLNADFYNAFTFPTFLAPTAFAYYLPAFMIADLTGMRRFPQGELYDLLSPPFEVMEPFAEIAKGFTTNQK